MENEKRLIDANATLAGIAAFMRCYAEKEKELPPFWVKVATQALDMVRQFIKEMPTVDAVEVVHARWNPIRNFGGGECYGYCTNCKTPVKADNATGLVMNNRFCHWCGAKMDGDGNE